MKGGEGYFLLKLQDQGGLVQLSKAVHKGKKLFFFSCERMTGSENTKTGL